MDTLEQKLTQALQANESLRKERDKLLNDCDALQRGVNGLTWANQQHVKKIEALTVELTLAKQETANARHELRSAVAVITFYAGYWLEGPQKARQWLALFSRAELGLEEEQGVAA